MGKSWLAKRGAPLFKHSHTKRNNLNTRAVFMELPETLKIAERSFTEGTDLSKCL